jgi:hyperpolarization activated cyclic nucleotide-gated potassium channel 2
MRQCTSELRQHPSQSDSRHDEPTPRVANILSKTKSAIASLFSIPNNRMTSKFFSNERELQQEHKRYKESAAWIIHPLSSFRVYWDLAMIFILSINLIILPVIIAFYVDDYGTQWIVLNSITDSLFILDIIFNFRTGILTSDCPKYKDNKELVILDNKTIIIRYLKSWFILDAVSGIPFDNISLLFIGRDKNVSSLLRASRALRTLRMAKLLSLLKLLRITRLLRYVDSWEEVSLLFKPRDV